MGVSCKPFGKMKSVEARYLKAEKKEKKGVSKNKKDAEEEQFL